MLPFCRHHTYVCECVCVYIYIYIYIAAYMCRSVCVYIYIYIHIYIPVQKQGTTAGSKLVIFGSYFPIKCTYIHTYTHTSVREWIIFSSYTHKHIHKHTYISIHTHIRQCANGSYWEATFSACKHNHITYHKHTYIHA